MPLRRLVRLNEPGRFTVPAPLKRVLNLLYSAAIALVRGTGPDRADVRFHCDVLDERRLNILGRPVALQGWVDAYEGETPKALHATWAGFVGHVHVMTFQARPAAAVRGAPVDAASFLLRFDSSALLKILGLEVEYPSGRRLHLALFALYVPWNQREYLGRLDGAKPSYAEWSRRHQLSEGSAATAARDLAEMVDRPKISILVPVHETPAADLERVIASVRDQWYPEWELCIADDGSSQPWIKPILSGHAARDPRIKVLFRPHTGGIAQASNSALSLATGKLIALLDHDGQLSPDALWEVARAWRVHEPDILYSDEDREIDGVSAEPFFKPCYSPDQSLTMNYMSHFLVTRRDLMLDVGGFREGFEGSHDHDLVLRLLERSDRVAHIPRVLYHRVASAGSTALSAKSETWQLGLSAVRAAVERRCIDATVELGPHPGTYRVRRRIQGNPLVSIIIPFRDKVDLTLRCVRSVVARTAYRNFEVLLVSNGSQEPRTLPAVSELVATDRRLRLVEQNIPFNYSTLNNFGASQVDGEHLLFLNNDTEVLSSEWLEALLEHSQRPEVGAVGAKLYLADETVQHAGVVVGLGEVAGHGMRRLPRQDPGYFGQLGVVRNVSAVTGACMMIEHELFAEVGGFDEPGLAVSFNDVDLCLRLRYRGFLNVITPYCELFHFECQSRGSDDTEEKMRRSRSEARVFMERHAEILEEGDPYYNPNLSRTRDDYSLGAPTDWERKTRVMAARGR